MFIRYGGALDAAPDYTGNAGLRLRRLDPWNPDDVPRMANGEVMGFMLETPQLDDHDGDDHDTP